jgi:myosin heavy chain 9/10/11/14
LRLGKGALQLKEDEEQKRNFGNKMTELTFQMQKMKKKADEKVKLLMTAMTESVSVFIIFPFHRHLHRARRIHEKAQQGRLQRQIQELIAANNRLDKSKKKSQLELEDATIELENRRNVVA